MEIKELNTHTEGIETYNALRANKKLILYHFIRDYDNSYYHTDTGFPVIKASMTPKGTIQIGESRELTSSHIVSDKFDKVRIYYQMLPGEMKINNVNSLNLQSNIMVFGENKHVQAYDIGEFGIDTIDTFESAQVIKNYFDTLNNLIVT